MSRHKYTNLICIIIVAFAVILTAVIMIWKGNQGSQDNKKTMPYESKLYNTESVHNIDIKIKQSDWDSIQKNASKKEYQQCDVVIDGKTFKNAAIRAKGNSSLSSVARQGLERYSFKIEFDHYNDGSTCWGLDKLSLNNIIQDKTYMKDYLSYTLMREMGADAPLCSYIFVKVNGEDFGLYLAVEGIEESFAQRNYGTNYGNLYKPETSDGIGNMGNRDNNNFNPGQGMPGNNKFNKRQDLDQNSNLNNNNSQSNNKQSNNNESNNENNNQDNQNPNNFQANNINNNNQGFGNNRGFGGMSNASDVALKYTDDEISSYTWRRYRSRGY